MKNPSPRERVEALIVELMDSGRKKDAEALREMLKGRDLALRENLSLSRLRDHERGGAI